MFFGPFFCTAKRLEMACFFLKGQEGRVTKLACGKALKELNGPYLGEAPTGGSATVTR